jgi:hypothetical protein
MDAGSERDIAGVVIRGRHQYNQYVKSFKVQYAGNNGRFYDVDGGFEFSGSHNWHDSVSVPFSSSVRSRYIRIFPRSWHGHMSMRCALIVGPVNCEARWENSGGCSAFCGPGKQTQVYTITKHAEYDGVTCSGVGSTRQVDCHVRACPPPPSPPPPPGEFKEATVSMENPVSLISAYSFDFGIRVTHVSCENENDCFESITNDEVERHETGLRCDAKVKLRGEECSSYGPSLPCREWIDFLPKSLEMTNDQGQIIDGEYDIFYSCYFVLPDGSKVHPPQGREETLHTFTLRSGCSETMPHGRNQKLENAARQLLLTSDEFNVADCRDETQIYAAKETVFRRYDNNRRTEYYRTAKYCLRSKLRALILTS